jgi:hypothetical protein
MDRLGEKSELFLHARFDVFFLRIGKADGRASRSTARRRRKQPLLEEKLEQANV